jgi:hypothetical protein
MYPCENNKADTIGKKLRPKKGVVSILPFSMIVSAHLPCFPAHRYRHLAVALDVKACKNGGKFKAISQTSAMKHIHETHRDNNGHLRELYTPTSGGKL